MKRMCNNVQIKEKILSGIVKHANVITRCIIDPLQYKENSLDDLFNILCDIVTLGKT